MTAAGWIALAIAVAGAFCYAAGSILQAVGAQRSRGTVRTMGHPLYLIGVVFDLLAWAGSMVALRELAVYLVESVLAGSLAITVVLARLILKSRLRRRDVAAIAISVGALTVLAMSAGEQESVPATATLRYGFLGAAVLMMILGWGAAKVAPPGVIAGLAGLSLGAAALAGRALAMPTGGGGTMALALATDPMTWALLVFAVGGMVMYTHALQRGQVGPVTAVLWIGEVIAPSAVALIVLGDTVRPGWELRAAIAGLVVVGAAVVLATAPATSETARAAEGAPAEPATAEPATAEPVPAGARPTQALPALALQALPAGVLRPKARAARPARPGLRRADVVWPAVPGDRRIPVQPIEAFALAAYGGGPDPLLFDDIPRPGVRRADMVWPPPPARDVPDLGDMPALSDISEISEMSGTTGVSASPSREVALSRAELEAAHFADPAAAAFSEPHPESGAFVEPHPGNGAFVEPHPGNGAFGDGHRENGNGDAPRSEKIIWWGPAPIWIPPRRGGVPAAEPPQLPAEPSRPAVGAAPSVPELTWHPPHRHSWMWGDPPADADEIGGYEAEQVGDGPDEAAHPWQDMFRDDTRQFG